MIGNVFARLARTGIWRVADDAELPRLERGGNQLANQLLVMAGGLALTLSRCSPDEQRRSFPRAAQLYVLLRRELKLHGKTTASSALLLDAFHETSEQLDPYSRQAFHRCLDARMRYERMDESQPASGTDSPSSLFTSLMPVSDDRQATPAPVRKPAHPARGTNA